MEMPFGVVRGVSPGNHVLDGRAHRRHVANTVKRLFAAAINGSSTTSCNTARSQITLGSLVYYIFIKFIIHPAHQQATK